MTGIGAVIANMPVMSVRYYSSFCLMILCSLASASESAQVLSALESANQARQEQARLTDAWRAEEQRLQLLIAESKRQQQNISKQIEQDKRIIADKKTSLEQFNSQAEQSLALDAALLELSERCHEQLNLRALTMTGGSIAAQKNQAADPAMQFLHAVARLQQSLHNSEKWQVSLSEGLLDDKPFVCEMLRMGNAYAWWASRDGKRAGIVKRQNGKNMLVCIDDDTQSAAIHQAIAIVQGDQAPTLLALPIHKEGQP